MPAGRRWRAKDPGPRVADSVPPDANPPEALLRRFEPVIRFTKGEWFYPMDAEPYVQAASLWVRRPGEEAVCVVPAGELTLDRLAQQPEDSANAVHYLKIPPPPKNGKRGSLARRRVRRSHTDPEWPTEAFRAGRGRLARVGYVSRLADAPEANLLAYSLCAHLMFLVTNATLGACFLPFKAREIWELAEKGMSEAVDEDVPHTRESFFYILKKSCLPPSFV